jgi:CheY-like chemotaxis protein
VTAETPGGKTLLVVEDNEICREGLATLLRREGYTVVTAPGGREALGRLRGGFSPDLILLDMLLPAGDGWDFLKCYRRDPSLAGPPVIILTALGIASPEWATSLGAAGLVKKPIETSLLLQEVRRCLAR